MASPRNPAPTSRLPTTRRRRDPDVIPISVGNFTRLEEIGRGSFATVYHGVHNRTQNLVAIKSVSISRLNKKLKDNLKLEINILKAIHHPHIVMLLDCQETSHEIHLVMEYCVLGDLAIFIKKRESLVRHQLTRDLILKYPNPRTGGLNEVIVRHFLKQLASALHFLRSKDLVHRDVKPQNLLLNPSPQSIAKGEYRISPYKGSEDLVTPPVGLDFMPLLKLADFGFARSLPSTSLADTLCGSPLYMAPEILRYEKYDAKADLWSVGTVLYEMVVGKPYFKASNHVELLQKIERANDRIKFPEHCEASETMRWTIRQLLKRNPVERIGFNDFFESSIIKGDIPGLVTEDQPNREPSPADTTEKAEPLQKENIVPEATYSSSPSDRRPLAQGESQRPITPRPASGISSRPSTSVRRVGSRDTSDLQRAAVTGRQQNMTSQPSSPGRPQSGDFSAAAHAMERQRSRNTSSPGSSLYIEKAGGRETPPSQRAFDNNGLDERERAAQEVAFERDYVLVEKKAVEVNAFADELAASPRLQQQSPGSARQAGGAIVRRATTNSPNTSQGVQARALQMVTGRPRADSSHHRQSSYERRYGPSPTSATSAISKALNMASGRLFGVGFSPPLALTKGGRSPPLAYNPFPAYPLAQGNLVVVGDGAKTQVALDEDTKTVQIIEECATRSDVVYGFAEVKYKQLIPLAPSVQSDTAIHPGAASLDMDVDPSQSSDGGLTVDAVVTLSEEALVLYVKALSLLAKSMDIAGAWWARKNAGEILGDSQSAGSGNSGSTSPAVGNRINNVVQWVRNRFNEVLEKAEFVRLKLLEGQKRLPTDHPSHPSNHRYASEIGLGLGTSSVDQIVVSSGITAEKLMYDRAVEMSRTAAINELTGEDLPGCEIAYVTAIRMLEAVLESDEDTVPNKSSQTGKGETANQGDMTTNGVQVEEREIVIKLVAGARKRLTDLQNKMALMAKRTSAPPVVQGKAPVSHHRRPSSPAIASASPR
ncbi:ULK/ULK protein kinase [Helicocarpus griseus UAMH5409]|uniref:Serine/threonine-protein kinase ATG1 n=1 Tax=Helicocarpus griseus UAMH5409 TaxID=1447875 RepID=A0A2B7X6D6_9EURO|nr:ULK/ULK protein kinase [Helicocarpus griseus UAMH5409]